MSAERRRGSNTPAGERPVAVAMARDAHALGPLLGPALATILVLAMLGWFGSARAATYKWVDEKGVVHYTDKIPTEAAGKGSTMLDKQARPVKKIEPAASPEQIRAREAEEEVRRLTAKANEEIARRDRALVSSYTTESEIELARSRALGTIDAQLESSGAYSQQLTKRRAELEQQKTMLAGKTMPVALEREFEGNESELEKTTALIDQKRRERAAIVARYDADKARWRELKSIADASAAALAASPARPHPAAAGQNGASAAPKK